MPYENKSDLPDAVKDNLPSHAQSIYLEAYNSAFQKYKNPNVRKEGATREEAARRVAWSAVKNNYEKKESGKWEKI